MTGRADQRFGRDEQRKRFSELLAAPGEHGDGASLQIAGEAVIGKRRRRRALAGSG